MTIIKQIYQGTIEARRNFYGASSVIATFVYISTSMIWLSAIVWILVGALFAIDPIIKCLLSTARWTRTAVSVLYIANISALPLAKITNSAPVVLAAHLFSGACLVGLIVIVLWLFSERHLQTMGFVLEDGEFRQVEAPQEERG